MTCPRRSTLGNRLPGTDSGRKQEKRAMEKRWRVMFLTLGNDLNHYDSLDRKSPLKDE